MSKKKKKEPFPKFPFEKMPYQLHKDSDDNLKDYDLESTEELDLGESERRKKRRSLDSERGAGHEP